MHTHFDVQATVAHLRGLLQTSHLDSEMLLASKSREKQLTQQVQSLSQELVEARKHHTPVSEGQPLGYIGK